MILEGPKQPLREALGEARTALGERFPSVVVDNASHSPALGYWLGAVLLHDVQPEDDGVIRGQARSDLMLSIVCLQTVRSTAADREDQQHNVFRTTVLLAVAYEMLKAEEAAVQAVSLIDSMAEENPVLEGSFPVLVDGHREKYEAVEQRLAGQAK
ncbi:MAG: hypothetical protein FKY71_14830 [Spiribacter salinus]|uniref:Uncharacterized protein n=1 Tax=Spiribacter salinus TaxID=1335746 RepID=A0A540VNB0_9GAMM|nr:MAG: hypothetical protein FKY71_14830 [Spiribacter salinus]